MSIQKQYQFTRGTITAVTLEVADSGSQFIAIVVSPNEPCEYQTLTARLYLTEKTRDQTLLKLTQLGLDLKKATSFLPLVGRTVKTGHCMVTDPMGKQRLEVIVSPWVDRTDAEAAFFASLNGAKKPAPKPNNFDDISF